MSYEQIISPKTGRKIYIYGDAYDKLIKEGHKETELLSLPRFGSTKVPKSPKIKKILQKETIKLLPEELILNEILTNMDPTSFMHFCRTDKKYKKLCEQDDFWKKSYHKRYNDGDTYLKKIGSYYELYKKKFAYEKLNKTWVKITLSKIGFIYKNSTVIM